MDIRFRSRDQGWSSSGPDGGSWSWFEASLGQFGGSDEEGRGRDGDAVRWTGLYEWVVEWLRRHDEELEKEPRYRIQTNRHASTEPEEYTVELAGEHELVRRVEERDRVVLWACACFPGWENRLYEAEIVVLGMDDLTME